MNEQTKKDARRPSRCTASWSRSTARTSCSHNEPPVVNAGVLEMAEIFRMFNIFDEKFSPSNIDKADGTPLRSTPRR